MRNVEEAHYVGFIRINIDTSDMKDDLQRNLLTGNFIEVLIEFVALKLCHIELSIRQFEVSCILAADEIGAGCAPASRLLADNNYLTEAREAPRESKKYVAS